MNTRLTTSPFPIWSNCAKQSLCILHIPGNVIIPKDNYFPCERGIFCCDLSYRPLAQFMAIHHCNGAEITLVRTATGCKNDSISIVVPMKQLFASHWHICKGRHAGLLVHTNMRSYFKALQEFFP